MKLKLRTHLLLAVFAILFSLNPGAHAESQSSDYKGITDPFGDPSNYEFAEDEKEDKEFFHLGRFLMLGFDFGAGIFTGGLGQSTEPGFYVGAKLIYFFDRSLAMEVAAHYVSHLDSVHPTGAGNSFIDIDTKLIPLTLGLRYYFDTRDAPRAIALANPYLALGGGVYLRNQEVLRQSQNITFELAESSNANFGGYGGAGVEFLIYRRNIYLGIDVRYHMVFFNDENDTFADPGTGVGLLQPGDRSGDYFTSVLSLTYNF